MAGEHPGGEVAVTVPVRWRPRRFLDDDVGNLAALSGLVFGSENETADEAFLRWQYFDNPAGRVVGWAAVSLDREELAGSYCVIPVRMMIAGQERRASLSLNTMTHPDYRKQGIFTTLAELTYGECAESGLILTTGIPNDQSYAGLAGPLHFANVGRRLLVVKALRLENAFRRFVGNEKVAALLAAAGSLPRRLVFPKVRRNDAIRVSTVERFDERFDDLWQRCRNVAPNMVVRDSEFLTWRFTTCPTRRYRTFEAVHDGRLAGYLTLSEAHRQSGMNVAFVTDILIDPAIEGVAVWRSLLAEAESAADADGLDLLAVHMPQVPKMMHVLRGSGYRVVPDRMLPGPHAFMVRPHLPETFDVATATDFASWYVMDADNDRP